jgi:hypothetical protein
MSTHSSNGCGKEAFCRYAIDVSNCQGLVSRFQSSNGSNDIRIFGITFSARVRVGGLASGYYRSEFIGDGNLRHRYSLLPSQRRKSRRFGDESEIVLLDCGEPAFDNFLQIEPMGRAVARRPSC